MVTKKLRCGRGFNPRSRFSLTVALCLFFTTLFTSRAALQFDVVLGYNGVIPHSAWFPITCELHNDGPSFNAVIEVTSGRGGLQSQTRRLPIELPTNTRKRVTIPVFAEPNYQGWAVRLVSERGKVLAEPSQNSMQTLPGVPVMATLARTVAGNPALPGIRSRNNTIQPVSARLQQEAFPENPIVLDGIPLLYLNSERALSLTAPQVNALLAWLHNGGHLVVAAEQAADLTAAEWLRNLLPCEFKQMGQLKSHPAFHDYLQDWESKINREEMPKANPALAKVEEDQVFESAALPYYNSVLLDGKITVGTPESPLAIQAPRGLGKITVLTFNPEREPFSSWKNKNWFWTKLADVSPELYTNPNYQGSNPYYGVSTDGVLGAMIDSKQVRKLPLGILLLLLVAYLAVIGPIDRYWLKKINRQMLTWITFPIYVLAFSGLIYVIGFHLRAGELEYNELTILDVLPGELNPAKGPSPAKVNTVLRGQTYCSIYSPGNNTYKLKGEQPFAVLRDEFQTYRSGSGSRAEIVQHGNAFDAEAAISVWTSRLFVSDWLQPGPQPLSLTVTPKEKAWDITVANNTSRTLSKLSVVLGGRVYGLADLPPNQTSHQVLTIDKGTILFELVKNNTPTLMSAARNRGQSFGNNVNYIPDNNIAATVLSFAALLPGPQNNYDRLQTPAKLDLTPYNEKEYGVLLAWDMGYSYTKPLRQFNAGRVHQDTLLRLVVPVKTN